MELSRVMLCTNWTRTTHQHSFARVVLFSYFPALSLGFAFSRAFYQCQVFPHSPLPAYFPAFFEQCTLTTRRKFTLH